MVSNIYCGGDGGWQKKMYYQGSLSIFFSLMFNGNISWRNKQHVWFPCKKKHIVCNLRIQVEEKNIKCYFQEIYLLIFCIGRNDYVCFNKHDFFNKKKIWKVWICTHNTNIHVEKKYRKNAKEKYILSFIHMSTSYNILHS